MNNLSLQKRKETVFARGQGTLTPRYIDKAKNAELWDIEGKRYIDFGSGIAVVNCGHSHSKVCAAIQAQLQSFTHTCVMVTPYGSAVELAESLVKIAPGDSPKKAILVSTGAEAVENCIKIARAHTGRPGVIAFSGGFHGRTNMAMGLTGKVAPYKAGFGPFPNDIYHLPFPNEYHGVSEQEALTALDHLFAVEIEPARVGALIIEPVQGEGGFYPASPRFMQALRARCSQHGMVMIADEIQTGFARTGKMFACEYADVEPDLITMAKGIANGLPLAAVVGKAEIMDSPLPGGLGGTYGGSPLACSAALAVLQVIEEEHLCERAQHIGQTTAVFLKQLQAKHPQTIGDVRHLGAMIAMEFVRQGDVDQPYPELAKALVELAARKGLILLSCGVRSNVIRFLPPLTIENETLAEGLALLEESLDELI